MDKRWLWGMAALLAIVLIGVAMGSRYERYETLPIVSEPIRGAEGEATFVRMSEERWEEVRRWQDAETLFLANTETPAVLYRNESTKQTIFALRGAVYYESETAGGEANRLLLETKGERIGYWTVGNHLLIGESVQPDNPDSSLRGVWYSVTVDETSPPRAERIEGAFYGPDDVLAVTAATDPAVFLLAVAEDDRGYREYVYRIGDKEMGYVSVFQGTELDDKTNRRPPAKTNGTRAFENVVASVGNNLYAFEDDRGAVIAAFLEEGHFGAVRYPDRRAEKLAWKMNLLGQNVPMALVRDKSTNEALLVNLFGGSALEDGPDLLDDSWRMVDLQRFYRVEMGTIDTVRYFWDGTEWKMARKLWKPGGEPIREEQGVLVYSSDDGSEKRLSIYDLFHSEGELDHLWLRNPLFMEEVEGSGEGEERWPKSARVKLPKSVLEAATYPPGIPAEVKKAMEASNAAGDGCLFNCDPDFAALMQIRSIDGQWHVLLGKDLYRMEGEGFQRLGEWPVAVRTMVGEGANGYYAQDYAKADGQWIIADTFADRVIKLDEAFRVVGQVELPAPNRVKLLGKGKVEIGGLSGTTTIDVKTMKVEKVVSANWEKIDAKIGAWEETEVREGQIYDDPNTGNRWVVLYDRLLVFPKAGSKMLSYFVGYPESGRTIVKIIPYRDDVFVLSDHRAEKFGKDGKWKQTILYPKNEATCQGWATGEGSHAYDSKKGLVYWVHGCGVLGIDLEEGSASLVFDQAESKIGAPVLVNGTVVFSLEGNADYGYDAEGSDLRTNELVALRTETGETRRYRLDKGWATGEDEWDRNVRTDAGRIPLWNRSAPNGGSAMRYGVIDFSGE